MPLNVVPALQKTSCRVDLIIFIFFKGAPCPKELTINYSQNQSIKRILKKFCSKENKYYLVFARLYFVSFVMNCKVFENKVFAKKVKKNMYF